jgi:hypothetical protein
MPGFFCVQRSVMVVIVATIVAMVAIVAVVIGAVVVAVVVVTTVTVVADDAAAEGGDGRQKHGDDKQAFHDHSQDTDVALHHRKLRAVGSRGDEVLRRQELRRQVGSY